MTRHHLFALFAVILLTGCGARSTIIWKNPTSAAFKDIPKLKSFKLVGVSDDDGGVSPTINYLGPVKKTKSFLAQYAKMLAKYGWNDIKIDADSIKAKKGHKACLILLGTEKGEKNERTLAVVRFDLSRAAEEN